jgi:hypothetical protein
MARVGPQRHGKETAKVSVHNNAFEIVIGKNASREDSEN